MHKAKRHAKIKGTGASGKAIVHGMLQRGGHIRASVVHNQTRERLQSQIQRQVAEGATLYTDTHVASQDGLQADYIHEMIDHAEKYFEGRVHTNGIENFWSLLKRGLNGTYVAVARFHLQQCIDEQVLRFNKRKGSDATRLLAAMLSVCGKRLTFAELIGKMT
jgi:hypothetical protein